MVKVIEQKVTDTYAAYNGDCCEALNGIPDESIHHTIYSPPFYGSGSHAGLYSYSSSPRDFSNCRNYGEFLQQYEFLIEQLHRITMKGRLSAVHCMDVPKDGANCAGKTDFPGDIIRLHEKIGWEYWCRYHIWKEPLAVRNRTLAKGLAHKQIVLDSTLCDVASADYLLCFRKKGENPIPVAHEHGLTRYAGERQIPADRLRFKVFQGDQKKNRYSHWIWRQYASAFWDDIRLDKTLPYKEARDPEDERHCHPLQLDVIERSVILRTNPGETVLTPFMGVGSEVYGALINNRKGVGIELKPSYYRQAVKNLDEAANYQDQYEPELTFAATSELD